MHGSDFRLLEELRRELNPPIADLERENRISELRIERAIDREETAREYVIRQIMGGRR